MTELPKGWKLSTLSEVAKWGSGGTPTSGRSDYYSGDIPWAVIGDMNDSFIYNTEKLITREGLDSSSAKLVPVGAVLIAMYGSIGKLGIAGIPMATNQAIAFALPNEEIVLQKFLFWFLRSQRDLLLWSGKGATQQNISQTVLKAWQIPLPSIAEQHQIVEILEDHLSRLDAALASLELAIIQVNTFEMSSINKAIESVPCKYLPLRVVIEKIEACKSFTCLSRKSEPDEWGIIKVSAMTWGEFLPEENKAVPSNREVNIRNQIHQGDILISRANTEKYVGAPVFVRDEPPRLLLSDKSLRLKPAQGIDPNWLITVLRAPTTRERISARSTGMKDSMRNISQKSLLSVEVPVPITLSNQSEVVRNANEARDASIQLRSAVEDNLKLLESLRRSLLQAAFAGQLTREATHV